MHFEFTGEGKMATVLLSTVKISLQTSLKYTNVPHTRWNSTQTIKSKRFSVPVGNYFLHLLRNFHRVIETGVLKRPERDILGAGFDENS